jgi:hypothetical protein
MFLVGFGYLCYNLAYPDRYWRNDIDEVVKDVFGTMKFEDALIEVNLPVYDIKGRNLNFYSKANY